MFGIIRAKRTIIHFARYVAIEILYVMIAKITLQICIATVVDKGLYYTSYSNTTFMQIF